jgi:hypothetical protein
MLDLTGLKVSHEDIEGPIQTRIGPSGAKVLGISEDTVYGSSNRVGPLFYLADPEAISLGFLVDREKPGFGYRRFDQWTSVYSAASAMPPAVLRGIARMAGVHVYNDKDDAVYANDAYVAMHASSTGERTVRLRRPAIVVDAVSGRRVAEGTDRFTTQMTAGQTGLWRLESSS